ncbi:MAG TPA: PAS domain S-box protein, partial [Caldithrix sp.]|nr:PAS domain S-box protein [Caldithrix sp.]
MDLSAFQLIDQHPDGVCIIDCTGKMLYVNDSFCGIINKEKKALVNKSFSSVFQKSEQSKYSATYFEQILNNLPEPYNQMQHTLWDNRLVWFEYCYGVLTSENIIIFIRNITFRKLDELEIIKSEDQFRKFFQEGSDGILINRISKDRFFDNFLEANKQACELLNYSRDEIINKNIYNIISIWDNQKIEHFITTLMKDTYALLEINLITKDKRKIPVEINGHVFEYNGRPAIISVVRDITKRSQANIELNKSREQLRSLALRLQNIREEERSMIAREIHDELGQLLTVLKIQISLISKKLPPNQTSLQERVESSIQFIDQAVKSIQKITTQLRPGILDELGLIAAIEWQAREFEKQTGIQCDCTLPKETINLDPKHSTALFRITQEALTNAARHSFAERVSIYLKEEDDRLVLEITDNGKGIHQAQINNPNSLGLLGIKERAMVFGGKVTINGIN